MYDADGVAVGDPLTGWVSVGNGRYMLHVEDVPRDARVIVVTESTYGVVQAGPVETVAVVGRPRPYTLHRHGPRLIAGGS